MVNQRNEIKDHRTQRLREEFPSNRNKKRRRSDHVELISRAISSLMRFYSSIFDRNWLSCPLFAILFHMPEFNSIKCPVLYCCAQIESFIHGDERSSSSQSPLGLLEFTSPWTRNLRLGILQIHLCSLFSSPHHR